MDYRILGPLEALDGERRLPLGGARQRSVLALLLLHGNEALSRDVIIDQRNDAYDPNLTNSNQALGPTGQEYRPGSSSLNFRGYGGFR